MSKVNIPARSWGPTILLGPGVVFMLLAFALPLGTMAALSFSQPDGTPTLAHYIKFITEAQYRSVLWNSLRLSFYVTTISIVVGFPLAYAMARLSARWRNTILVVIITPLMISVVVRSFAWQILLGNGGPINRFLLGVGLIDEPLKLLFSEVGVVIGLVHVYLPFMVLPLASAIERIDGRLEEAAMILGANSLRRFVEVVLPLSVPGIAAGATLVFTASISAYVTPALLGGERIQVMPTMVAQQVLTLLDWSFGSAVSMILTFFSLGILIVYWIAASRFSSHSKAARS
jgi:putative spermidine/putrescine transport system permease protein